MLAAAVEMPNGVNMYYRLRLHQPYNSSDVPDRSSRAAVLSRPGIQLTTPPPNGRTQSAEGKRNNCHFVYQCR